jgi:hypothetical protein
MKEKFPKLNFNLLFNSLKSEALGINPVPYFNIASS